MAFNEQNDIIGCFEKLGLSSNEAKVYLALLENHPITGYQLSKNSGILRPVVYEMLNRLVEKGGARIIKSNPDTYIPVEIDEFLKNIESEFTESKKSISNTLKNFLVSDNTDFFWNIVGKKNIVNYMIKMIDNSQHYIYINIQNQDNLDLITRILEEKLLQGIDINIFSYYQLETRGITLYSFKLNQSIQINEISKDLIYLSIDNTEAIVVNLKDEKNAKAVYSKNESLVSIIHRSILNNIYYYRIWTYLGTDKLKALINNEDRKLLERIEKYLLI